MPPPQRPPPVSADSIGLILEEVPEPLPADALGIALEEVPEPLPMDALRPLPNAPVAASAVGLVLTEVDEDPDLADLDLSLDDPEPPRVVVGTRGETPPPVLRGQVAAGQPIPGRIVQGAPPPMVGSPLQGAPMVGTPIQGAPIQGAPLVGTPEPPAEPEIPLMEGIDFGRDSTALRPRKKAPPKPSEKRKAEAVTLEPGGAPEMEGVELTGLGEGAGRRRQRIPKASGELNHCTECGFVAPPGVTRCTNCGSRVHQPD